VSAKQAGVEIPPGNEAAASTGIGLEWTSVFWISGLLATTRLTQHGEPPVPAGTFDPPGPSEVRVWPQQCEAAPALGLAVPGADRHAILPPLRAVSRQKLLPETNRRNAKTAATPLPR
jgi:hypothetical protein